MVTFCERAANVNRMLSLLCPFVALIVSHFGFEGRTLFSVCISSWSMFTFYFFVKIMSKSCQNGMQILLFEHGFCCLKMASGLFESSFKQLYTYIFMQDCIFYIAHDRNL